MIRREELSYQFIKKEPLCGSCDGMRYYLVRVGESIRAYAVSYTHLHRDLDALAVFLLLFISDRSPYQPFPGAVQTDAGADEKEVRRDTAGQQNKKSRRQSQYISKAAAGEDVYKRQPAI